MALFDKDNHGKNLTNATIWLDSSSDSGDFGYPDNPGCGLRTLICVLGVIVVLCGGLFTCIANNL